MEALNVLFAVGLILILVVVFKPSESWLERKRKDREWMDGWDDVRND